MIINFSIENFGPIRDKQTLSFEAKKYNDLEDYYIAEPIKGVRLLKLAFLYGANASGKTTMLKGLKFLRDIVLDPFEKKNEKFDFKPFLFDDICHKVNSAIEINFIHKAKKYIYKVIFNRDFIANEILLVYNPNKSTVFTRSTDHHNQLTSILFGSKIKIHKDVINSLTNNTLWNNTVLGGFLKTNVDIIELKEVVEWFESVLMPMISPRTDLDSFVTRNIDGNTIKKENVVEVLRKADLNIEDIVIEEQEEEIPDSLLKFLGSNVKDEDERKKLSSVKETGKITSVNLEFIHNLNGKRFTLPFEDQSQGTQRLYGLAGIMDLLVRRNSIISIDELESSLHPDLYVHFVLMHLANSTNSQLIATTHNREILKNRDIFRNDCIWFADKTDEGNTLIYSLEDFDSKTIRDTSSVYNAYSIGKLGGVPELGDYYLDFKYSDDNDNQE